MVVRILDFCICMYESWSLRGETCLLRSLWTELPSVEPIGIVPEELQPLQHDTEQQLQREQDHKCGIHVAWHGGQGSSLRWKGQPWSTTSSCNWRGSGVQFKELWLLGRKKAGKNLNESKKTNSNASPGENHVWAATAQFHTQFNQRKSDLEE